MDFEEDVRYDIYIMKMLHLGETKGIAKALRGRKENWFKVSVRS